MRAGWKISVELICLLTLSTGCSPLFGGAAPAAPAATFTPLAPIPATAAPEGTQTPEPFVLELTPLPTATALPTLELPAVPVLSGEIQVWDGLPTYPAESRPDFYFRVEYDPTTWAPTTNQFGYPVLANRSIPECVLAPAVGRGLPQSGSVDHEVRIIGRITYQVSAATINGAEQFVNYAGGDGVIFSAFEVSFSERTDECLTAAEAVLGTLRSVPITEATPVVGS